MSVGEPRLGVVTVAHGRHEHLAAQEQTLVGALRPGDVRVRVALDDPALPPAPHGAGERVDVALGARPQGLPVGAARNLGARTALEHGAEALVFLDVDCLVAPGALAAYRDAVAEHPDVVWCGPVTYLSADDRPYPVDDPAALAALDAPHAARPAPAPGDVELGAAGTDDWALFWSLSFALAGPAWQRTQGFDEAYVGYGAEDTDLGQRAAAAGLRLGWLGSARAYHQHHPTERPPVQHLHDIVRNARLFHERWGWWPMEGWLDAFAELGLAERRRDGWHVAWAPGVSGMSS
jgi:GT2 family glycosyltransferase